MDTYYQKESVEAIRHKINMVQSKHEFNKINQIEYIIDVITSQKKTLTILNKKELFKKISIYSKIFSYTYDLYLFVYILYVL